MDIYQELTVTGERAAIEAFFAGLDGNACNWKPNTEILRHSLLGADYKAFDVPQEVTPRPSRLFLHLNASHTACSLANIVQSGGELNPKEYNAILQAFYSDCLQANVEKHQLQVTMTKSEVFLEDTLSPQNMALLEDFARSANPATGSSHPQDYRRWIAFISASVQDEQILETDLLREWLMSQGFPSDIAYALKEEYRFGVALIHELNAASSRQENVHVAP